MPPVMPAPKLSPTVPRITAVPPVIYSQPFAPQPSITVVAPELRTPKRSPARPAAAATLAWQARHPGGRVAAFGYKAFALQPWAPANLYANYHDGAPAPSYIIWAKDEPWKSRGEQRDIPVVLRGRPDLIVASLTDVRRGMAGLMPLACRAGYGIQATFGGTMTWKGVPFADDSIVLLERGNPRGC